MQVYAWMEFQLLIFGIWLWECSILPQTNSTTPQVNYRETCRVIPHQTNKHTYNKTNVPTQHDNFDLNNVDCVPSNTKFSRFDAILCLFEDNEAVIKMIIKGRSPTMRHVSRTHRVALDWLFDRINLDSKIQIRYIDTKHQLADILTKGNFARDEWNNLLHLFNINHLSTICCANNSSQNDGGKDVGTRRRGMNCGRIGVCSDELVFTCSDKFLIGEKSVCTQKSGDTHGYEETWKAGWEDIQKPMQRRVLKRDCKMHILAGQWSLRYLSLQKRNQGMWTFPNLKLGVKKMWQGNRLLVKQVRETICIQQIRLPGRSRSWKDRMVTQSTRVSSHNSP